MVDRCESFLERLGAYVDGEVDAAAAQEVEEHLRSCPRCRRAHEELLAADRILRDGIQETEVDPSREEQAAERLLARLRAEPEPAWAGGRERQGAGGDDRSALPRWIRSLVRGSTIRWAGGLAVATAAVLLAIRLGMPSRPVVSRLASKADVEQTATDQAVEPSAADKMTARQAPEARPAEPPVLMGKVQETTKGQAAPPPPAQVTTAQPEGNEATPPSEGAETQSAASAETGEPTGETQASPPSPSEKKAEDREELEVSPPAAVEVRSTPLPPGPTAGAVRDDRTRSVRGGRAAETTFKVKDLWQAQEQDTGKEEAEAPASDEAVGLFAAEDTLAPATNLATRLDQGSQALSAMAESEIDAAERARRWRTIGDLWEWLARRDGSSLFYARALEAYGEAAAADPEAGLPDPARLARARAGAGMAPEGEKPRE
jgi:anti-sigma factor RsiW